LFEFSISLNTKKRMIHQHRLEVSNHYHARDDDQKRIKVTKKKKLMAVFRRSKKRSSSMEDFNDDDDFKQQKQSDSASDDILDIKKRKQIDRRDVVNASFVALSVPLLRDVFHDLGFYSGPDDSFAEVPFGVPGEDDVETAVFAGGCFWCVEETFEAEEREKKVLATTSGYAGGFVSNPKYLDVGRGKTGHREVVRVLFDRRKISYRELLFSYFRQIDPTRDDGMFLDSGEQYTSAIYVNSDEQKREAIEAIENMDRLNIFVDENGTRKQILTKVIDLRDLDMNAQFFPAEIYHQDYFEKNKARYKLYRFMSGRDPFSQGTWENRFDKKVGGKENAFLAIFPQPNRND